MPLSAASGGTPRTARNRGPMTSEGGEPRSGLQPTAVADRPRSADPKKPMSHQNSTLAPSTASVGKPVM